MPSAVAAAFTAGLAFAAMEPVAYAAHRWVMHGRGWSLHRSHHRPRTPAEWRGRLEANDWYPVAFASVTVAGMAAGATGGRLGVLIPVGLGVTAYGAAYAFVHDVYTHRRLGPVPTVAVLDRLAGAHALHHRWGGEPYGMLWPIVPARLAVGGRNLSAVADVVVVCAPREPDQDHGA